MAVVGSVTTVVTAPPGATAAARPETVVVMVVVPPSVGFADALTDIDGVCLETESGN